MSAPEEPEVLPKRRITADGELGQLHNKYSRKRRRTKEEIAADNAREAEEKAEKDHQAAKAHAQRLRIAAKKEDEIQRREDQIRANSTRPDLVTMATHRKYHARAAEEAEMDMDELAGQADDSEGALTDDFVQLPPLSTRGTDSEPDLTLSNEGLEGEESGSDGEYKPAHEEGGTKDAGRKESKFAEVEEDEDEGKLFQEFLALRRKGEKKKKAAVKKPERGALRAQIEQLRDEPTPAPLSAKRKTLAIDVDESPKKGKRSKPAEMGGLKSNWKKLVSVDKHPPLPNKRESSPDVTEDLDNELKGEFAQDETDTNLASARKSKTTEAAVKKTLSMGTAKMGITLQAKVEPVDTSLPVKSEKQLKSTYVNGDLPFENHRRDLKDWQHKFIPGLCDWAGTIDQPFTANAHPDFANVVGRLWASYFPTTGVATDAVHFMAWSALKNWRSDIGKRVLAYLKNLFTNKPFNNDAVEIQEYVAANLLKVTFIYRDQKNMTGAYRSDIVLDVFASHLRYVMQIASTHGDQTGAMSVCVAAVERGLTLWKNGKEPSAADATKKNFVVNPWAEHAFGYLPKIKELSAKKWEAIVRLAAPFIKSPDLIDLTEESLVKNDMRADIQLSPDEDSEDD